MVIAQASASTETSLEKKRLVQVAANLHQLAIEQWEKLEQNSQNSSRPPSTDNPYQTKLSLKISCLTVITLKIR